LYSACVSYTVKETGYIDHAFPVEGDVVERGTLAIAKQSWTNWLPFAEKDAFPDADIGILGQFQSRMAGQEFWYNDKAKNEGEVDILLFNPYRWEYQWNGSVSIHGEESEFRFRFQGYTTDSEGRYVSFVLPEENSPDRLEFNRILGGFGVEISSFPYPLASFYAGGIRYPLYVALEPEYMISSDKVSEEELRSKREAILSTYKERNLAALVFRRDQKFQVVNKAGLGVAEIQGDTYTLYDTLPESDRPAMRRLIARFYAFIRLARQIHTETDTNGEPSLL
jgi:hypothetical protein